MNTFRFRGLSRAALILLFGNVVLLMSACDQQASDKSNTDVQQSALEQSVDTMSGLDSITTARIANADSEPGNWLAIGRSYKEQFYSPLKLINADNIKDLGLAWVFNLDTKRGQEATPLVVDGIMYFSTAWNKVKALDAKTGDIVWEFDPQVDRKIGALTCCDTVSRGIALYEGKIFLATLDGRLLAINAKTGEKIWDVLTIEHGKGYNITGAPRAAKGKVFIGNGGGDSGARGYVSAYDADTGEQVWRFYTAPGDPSKPFENPILAMAAKTWTGEYWKVGTGGTAWDAIVYDPELDQLYIGAGNGGPWDVSLRSPGGGDNLFLSSIIAVNPDTGAYLWHYQTTPEDAWDYTAVQPIILADLQIDGEMRKVLMQAPKNGFFYVLDRRSGELISAKTIVPISWAEKELDKNGRPVIKEEARYYKTGKAFIGRPGPGGAHNWQPMAYHPGTGLVYIPVMESPLVHMAQQREAGPEGLSITNSAVFNLGVDQDLRQIALSENTGRLLAWDPIKQQEAWHVEHPVPFNGGVLATAGNLVFQGEGNGEFGAYRADTGEQVWSFDAYSGIVAAPSTFIVDGEQYLAVLQGWGGGFSLAAGEEAWLSGPKRNISRVLVFKLGGGQQLPEPPPFPTLNPPPPTGTEQQVAMGQGVFTTNCARCHGFNAISGGTVPDLRYSALLHDDQVFRSTVMDGALLDNGMLPFQDVLTDEQVEAVRTYVIAQANAAKALSRNKE